MLQFNDWELDPCTTTPTNPSSLRASGSWPPSRYRDSRPACRAGPGCSRRCELVLAGLAHPAHRPPGPEPPPPRPCRPGRPPRPHRQAPHEPGDDQALQGVGPAQPTPSSREANTSSAPRQVGPVYGDRTGGGLMVVEQCPLKLPGRDRSPWAHSRPRETRSLSASSAGPASAVAPRAGLPPPGPSQSTPVKVTNRWDPLAIRSPATIRTFGRQSLLLNRTAVRT